jgi:hypothetical protein
MNYAGDLHSILTADGNTYTFPDEENRFLVYIGYGAPPIDYITRRGYKQHGETKVDNLLSTRQITIQLWRKPACDRVAYWQNRAALHDMLRPNRGGSLLLTLVMPDSTKRSIYLDASPGAGFNTPQTDNNNWELDEALEFIAFNPVWFNADQTVLAVAANASQNLVFPITFPILFGPGGVSYSQVITYTGSWLSYPILVVTGPYDNVTITHQQTGAVITLIIPIVAGQTRTLDLTPGAISVTDENGNSAFDELGIDTNLVDFAIMPRGLPPYGLAGGINTIEADIVGSGVGTTFTIKYYDRYYAI